MDLFVSPYTKLLKVSNVTRMESKDKKGKGIHNTLDVGNKKHYHYSLHTWLNMKIMEKHHVLLFMLMAKFTRIVSSLSQYLQKVELSTQSQHNDFK